MDEWAADGKFSPSEKKQLKEELARIDGDKTQVTDGYTKYGLGTPTAYNTAYTNYRTAINGVVSSSSETVAIPSDFATKRTAVLYAEECRPDGHLGRGEGVRGQGGGGN